MILKLILIVLTAVCSGAGFAQILTTPAAPLQPSPVRTNEQDNKSEIRVAYEKYSLSCMIFAVEKSWIQLNIHLFSTHDLNECDEKRFAPVTNESARAQLLVIYPNAEYRVHGPYFQMADMDVSSANNVFVDVGKLKFSLMGDAVFNILDAIKDFSLYKQVMQGNFTYVPFRTTGSLSLLWFEGSSLYELIAPDGKRYTMMSGSHILRNGTLGINLDNVGSFLNLPEGWRFEKRISDKIFRIFSTQLGGQEQKCLLDELGNVYIHNVNSSGDIVLK